VSASLSSFNLFYFNTEMISGTLKLFSRV